MSTVAERKEWLEKCREFHGHLCMGQALGARIGIKGMELAAPASPKDLIVFVENDRCVADAVLVVSGTRVGRRTLKLRDYGRMAAVFWNLATGKAYRVRAQYDGPKAEGGDALRALMELPDEAMVRFCEVRVALPESEMPGHPKRVVSCVRCGERVFDAKDEPGPEGPLCPACAHGAYYEVIGAEQP
jgi:formylmethanofuran dehydrogenase subunit E